MKPLTKRKIIDVVVLLATMLALDIAGAGLWSLLILPFGMWEFYDGMTRCDLDG